MIKNNKKRIQQQQNWSQIDALANKFDFGPEGNESDTTSVVKQQ